MLSPDEMVDVVSERNARLLQWTVERILEEVACKQKEGDYTVTGKTYRFEVRVPASRSLGTYTRAQLVSELEVKVEKAGWVGTFGYHPLGTGVVMHVRKR